jgi:Carboxypeptidase regulatory-like domain
VTLIGTRGAGSKSVRADGQGHFIFQAVDPGFYTLTAERQGFFSDERRREYQPVVEVASGQHVKNVPVRLMPTAVVNGEILDEYNDPIQNVEVKLLASQIQLGRMYLRPAGAAVTDDRGQYRIAGLKPGTYYVVAEYQNKQTKDSITAEATAAIPGPLNSPGRSEPIMVQGAPEPRYPPFTYPPLFYPATSDFRQAQSLAVKPGDELAANFIMLSAPLVSICGKVTNGMTGAPAGTASVAAFWTEYMQADGIPARVSPQDATFEIKGVAPGIYTLRAGFTMDNLQYAGEQTVEVGIYGAQNVEIAALPDFDAAGHVSIPESSRKTIGRVLVEFVGEGLMPGVRARADFPEFKFGAQLRPEKRYYASIRNLPEDYYLKALTVSGHDLPPGNVVLSGRGGDMELVLSPAGGHIEGVLFDSQEQPTRGSILLAPDVPDPGPPELFRRSRADAQGRFTLRGIPPGSYRLLALETLNMETEIHSPEFSRTLGNKGQHLLVEENGRYSVFLKLE